MLYCEDLWKAVLIEVALTNACRHRPCGSACRVSNKCDAVFYGKKNSEFKELAKQTFLQEFGEEAFFDAFI